MYSTCLHCTRDLGTNDVLETLPIGRRVAFDAAQGRLWVVCRSCAKWNLVPFDTRLESIDDCERIFSDTRTRFSTDNIGLARVREGLDLVRIGAPQRPEFASWRYGAQYARRRMQTLAIAGAGAAAGVAIVLGAKSFGILGSGMFGSVGWQVIRGGWQSVRDHRRRVVTKLPHSDHPTKLKMAQIATAHLDLSGSGMTIRFRYPGATKSSSLVTVAVSGADARMLARQMTGALNDLVGSRSQLADAIGRLESTRMDTWLRQAADEAVVGKPDKLVPRSAGIERWVGFGSRSVRLAALPSSDRLAVEMWLSEEDEAAALAGELALLERQWKAADELAKIADSLVPSMDAP